VFPEKRRSTESVFSVNELRIDLKWLTARSFAQDDSQGWGERAGEYQFNVNL
jgi:hypothetical protein